MSGTVTPGDFIIPANTTIDGDTTIDGNTTINWFYFYRGDLSNNFFLHGKNFKIS